MSNPFDDDASEDYFTRPGQGSRGFDNGVSYTRSEHQNPDDELNFYEAQIEAALQGSLDSTQKSRILLEESEDSGIKTAEQLVNQREQLERANSNLDVINSTTTQTQRHLNNIKSIFGGIKNKFAKKAPEVGETEKSEEQSKLAKTTERMKADTTGFYETERASRTHAAVPTLDPKTKSAIAGTRWEEMDNEIEGNLDGMSAQLRRLQNLGLSLGTEIEEQNELLDKVSTKTDKTDTVVRNQDRQMKKILGLDKRKPKPTDQ